MTGAVAEIIPSGVYLRSCLAPFADVLARTDVTDTYVNRPGEMWVETLGGAVERIEDASMSEAVLARLARQVAALTHQGVSREHPLLAATMPDGSRIQVVAPPATRGPLALAIRRQVSASMTLLDYESAGQFAHTRTAAAADDAGAQLAERIGKRKFADALTLAVRARRNIIVSGGTRPAKPRSSMLSCAKFPTASG